MINTCIVPLLASALNVKKFTDIFNAGLLLEDISFILMFETFLNPLLYILNT